MRNLALAVVLLLSGSQALALPCVGDYKEYRRRMLRSDWEGKICPPNEIAHLEDFPELCFEDEDTSKTVKKVTSYWTAPDRSSVAFTVIYEQEIGMCVPPNVENYWEPFKIIRETPEIGYATGGASK